MHRERSKTRWRTLFICLLLILLLGSGMLFVFFKYKKEGTAPSWLGNNMSRFSSWLAWRKKHLQQELTAGKAFIAAQKAEDAEIHFEFYTALPSMQVTARDPLADGADTGKKENHTPMAKEAAPVIQAADLDKALAEEHFPVFKLHMGPFRTWAAAQKLNQELLAAGIKTEIVKFTFRQQVYYRLEQGSYADEKQAKNIQRQLKNKGIASKIVKI